MIKMTLEVDGMACSMCEAHVNDAVRRAFPVKKVTSSYAKGITEILTEAPIDEDQLKKAVSDTGYTVKSIKSEPYEKKGFLFFRK